jgi:hypothetical protein
VDEAFLPLGGYESHRRLDAYGVQLHASLRRAGCRVRRRAGNQRAFLRRSLRKLSPLTTSSDDAWLDLSRMAKTKTSIPCFSEIVSEDPADFAKADHCDSLKVLRYGFVGDRR